MITINQFVSEYGIKKSYLLEYGITFYDISKYGNTPLDELPVDYHMKFMAVLTKHGYFCEGCKHD